MLLALRFTPYLRNGNTRKKLDYDGSCSSRVSTTQVSLPADDLADGLWNVTLLEDILVVSITFKKPQPSHAVPVGDEVYLRSPLGMTTC